MELFRLQEKVRLWQVGVPGTVQRRLAAVPVTDAMEATRLVELKYA